MRHEMKAMRAIAVLGLAFALIGSALAGTRTLGPDVDMRGRIDTRLANQAIHILIKGTPEQKRELFESIKARPEIYAPPVFYVLSHVLFQDGQKDEGAFWFYAGQLRARFDANRCAEASARQAVAVLNRSYGFLINQYVVHDIPKLESLISTVVEWDRKTPYHYDHRWINLHGLHAVLSGLEGKSVAATPDALSVPEDQWDAIAEQTRADYLRGFQHATARMKGER